MERSGRIKIQLSAAERTTELQTCQQQRDELLQHVDECSAAVDGITRKRYGGQTGGIAAATGRQDQL
jgi:hypothetical protein